MKLLILRHGETAGNAARRYVGGDTDEPLSSAGADAARAKAPDILSLLAREGLEMPHLVWVSPLVRARQTARLLFPQAEQRICEGLREMHFGRFEGRTADEMSDDAEYRAWVDGMCEGPCPGGESRATFSRRSCEAVREVLASTVRCVAAEGAARQGIGSVRHEDDSRGALRRDSGSRATACCDGDSHGALCRDSGSRAVECNDDGLCCFVAHGGTVMAVLSAWAEPPAPYFSWHVGCCEGYLCDVVLDEGALRLLNPTRV